MTRQSSQSHATKASSMRRVAAASLAGTTMEYYDYFAFGTASALVFGEVFFPSLSETGAILASFATLSVSFFVRPVGAILFGHFGDRLGRKRLLIVSIFLMGGSTFLVGLLPTPQAIGVAAPIALVMVRVLQGLAVAGEWGGAALLAVEHAPPRSRGFYGSFPMIGLGLGLLLSSGSFAALTLLPESQFLAWGWRIPFLASALLFAVAMYIRLRISETPVFKEAQRRALSQPHTRVPVVELFRYHWKALLRGIGIRLAGDVQGYIVTAFAASYIVHQLNGSRTTATAAIAAAGLVSIIVMPFFGLMSDRIGRKPIYLGGTILGVVLAFPFFWLLKTESVSLIIVAAVLMYGLAAMVPYTVQGTIFAELFPTRVRYSGTSFAYQAEGIIGGGPAAFIAGGLIAWSDGATWPVSLYIMATGVITLVATLLTKESFRKSLYDEPQSTPAPSTSISGTP